MYSDFLFLRWNQRTRIKGRIEWNTEKAFLEVKLWTGCEELTQGHLFDLLCPDTDTKYVKVKSSVVATILLQEVKPKASLWEKNAKSLFDVWFEAYNE